MSDSERYVPPPPPYELFLQHDQKVVDVQALDSEVLKARSFRDQLNDWALSDKTPRGVAIHTAPSTPKGPPRPASENIRVPRPLPPSPADTHLRGQASRFASVADTKLLAVQNDRATEPYVLAPPPFSATPLSLDEGAYGQSVYHPTPSVYSTPFHYPPQPSYGARRRNTDDRWRIPAYLPTESCTETLTSFRRSSHTSAQTPSSCLSQDDTFRARLAFDPSLAYGGSQVHSRTASPGMAAALYSSAVSSHLQRDSATISGSRQYAPPRPALRNTETPRLDKTDLRSSRAHPHSSPYILSPTSLHTPEPQMQSGYEQRWATSESDITRDIYRR